MVNLGISLLTAFGFAAREADGANDSFPLGVGG